MSRTLKGIPPVLVLLGLLIIQAPLPLCSQTNPELTFSFEGPCGEHVDPENTESRRAG